MQYKVFIFFKPFDDTISQFFVAVSTGQSRFEVLLDDDVLDAEEEFNTICVDIRNSLNAK
jgi:hypothetical protein